MHQIPILRIGLLAGFVSLVIALAFPVTLIVFGYGSQSAAVRTMAQMKAASIAQAVEGPLVAHTTRPLFAAQFPVAGEYSRLLTPDGRLLAEAGAAPAEPLLTEQVAVVRGGRLLGVLEVSLSMRPLLTGAAWTALIGLVLGLAVFLVLWMLPLRELKRAAHALWHEKERAQVTLRSIADGVLTTDAAGRVDYANPQAEAILGQPLDSVRGRRLGDLLNFVDELTMAPLDLPWRQPGAKLAEAGLLRPDGSTLSIEPSAAILRDGGGGTDGEVVVLHDVTESRRLTRRLHWQATHDNLTGLANRAEFERRCQAALERAHAFGEPACLCFIDLDQFKIVNDLCGHGAGDQMLRQIATMVVSHLRRSDVLARLGGDEFGLLLENCPTAKAMSVVEKLLVILQDWRFRWDGKVFPAGMSVGFVTIDTSFDSVATLLSAADAACYAAKDGGRHRIVVYEPQDANMADRHRQMGWAERITKALDEQRFRLMRQRYRSLSSGAEPQHCELLLRMLDEDGTLVPPGAFIPAAERYNLMPRLDEWVITAAFRAFADLDRPSAERWSINLSGQSLSNERLYQHICQAARVHGVRPEQFCFEITETAAINNMSKALALIVALKKEGFTFALDDFGSGLSSFSYLKSMPVDYLKIDGAFIRDIHNDPVDHAMVKAIREVARVMGLKSIAEFVENDDILDKLRDLGIDFAQGYAVERPQPLMDEAKRPLELAAV